MIVALEKPILVKKEYVKVLKPFESSACAILAILQSLIMHLISLQRICLKIIKKKK